MNLLLLLHHRKKWAHVSNENNKKPPSIPGPKDGKSAWDINSSDIVSSQRISWSRPVKSTNQSSWLKKLFELNKIPIDDEKKPSSQSPGHQDSSQRSTDLQ